MPVLKGEKEMDGKERKGYCTAAGGNGSMQKGGGEEHVMGRSRQNRHAAASPYMGVTKNRAIVLLDANIHLNFTVGSRIVTSSS